MDWSPSIPSLECADIPIMFLGISSGVLRVHQVELNDDFVFLFSSHLTDALKTKRSTLVLSALPTVD